MGRLYNQKDKERFKRLNIKVYTDEELEALNLYLQKRDEIENSKGIGFVSLIVGEGQNYIQISQLSDKFSIYRDKDEIDWMVRILGTAYKKLFCLESWKRFSFGDNDIRHGKYQPSVIEGLFYNQYQLKHERRKK